MITTMAYNAKAHAVVK